MKTFANPAATAPHAAATSRPRRIAERIAVVGLGSLLVAICAHVSIPLWFTPVPVTLQTFAVLLLALLLGPEWSAATMAVYLAEGTAGLPVFSPNGPGGFLHLFGPTGGYLLAYPVAAWMTGALRQRLSRAGGSRSPFIPSLAAAAAGSVVILAAGAAWLGILSRQSPSTVLSLAVAPFLAGDILKVIAAAGAASGLRRFRRFDRTAQQ